MKITQILRKFWEALIFLILVCMTLDIIFTALANQYSPVNELMQDGGNWNVSRKHAKLLEVHQFLGTYRRILF